MRGKPRQLVPNYTVQEAINILPYIQSYCRDLRLADQRTRKYARLTRRLVSLIPINPEREKKKQFLLEIIHFKLECIQRRVVEWYQELDKLHLVICNFELGAIDVPVYVPEIDNVVYLCITPFTTSSNLEWHSLDENNDHGRLFTWIKI